MKQIIELNLRGTQGDVFDYTCQKRTSLEGEWVREAWKDAVEARMGTLENQPPNFPTSQISRVLDLLSSLLLVPPGMGPGQI